MEHSQDEEHQRNTASMEAQPSDDLKTTTMEINKEDSQIIKKGPKSSQPGYEMEWKEHIL